MRPLLALAFAAALATPSQAAPVPIAVVSLQTPGVPLGTSERIDTLVAALAEDGLIVSERPQMSVKKLKACGRAVNRETCARGRIREHGQLALPIHLALIANPGQGAQLRLVCIGPGRHRPLDPAPSAWIDLDAAMADNAAGGVWRARLAECLNLAAAERGF
jgi:hypothetical protein